MTSKWADVAIQAAIFDNCKYNPEGEGIPNEDLEKEEGEGQNEEDFGEKEGSGDNDESEKVMENHRQREVENLKIKKDKAVLALTLTLIVGEGIREGRGE